MLNDDDMKKTARRTKRRIPRRVAVTSAAALAAAGGAAALALGTTGHGSTSPQTFTETVSKGASKDAWKVPVTAVDVKDQSTWTLPLQRYQLRGNDTNTLLEQAAEKTAAAQCMKNFGLTYPHRVPESFNEAVTAKSSGPKNGMDGRYGIHDAKIVDSYGYSWPKGADSERALLRDENKALGALSASDRTVLHGWQDEDTGKPLPNVPRTVDGKAIPARGCIGQAQEQIRQYTGGTDTREDAVNKLERQAWEQMQADPRVQSVFAKWAAGMKSQGHTYKDPRSANNDPRWAGAGATSKEGIATAQADLKYRNEFHVNEVMHQVEAEKQNQLIAQNSKVIADARAYVGHVMRATNAILGR
ncbi:hypothetical protein [Streptomyces melanogenes]|uniref:hypothetical protein n=1 Tax=Streptomyces melanogenes TaxID=67326 RepID=UPI00379858DB